MAVDIDQQHQVPVLQAVGKSDGIAAHGVF